MTAEVKLVYGLNSPDEFEDAKAKLEATGAEDLLKRVVAVLPDTTFSHRGELGQGWPEYKVEGPRTSGRPDFLNSIYTSEIIHGGSISVRTSAPDRIRIEVNNGIIMKGREERGDAAIGNRVWQTDLPPDVKRQELAEAIFTGIQTMTNFDRAKLEDVRTALGLNPQEHQV